MKKLKVYLLVSLIILIATGSQLSAQDNLPGNFCVTNEEYRLYSLINEFRTQNELPLLSISASLSYVAKVHVRDLYNNKPDTSYCNLNSWSDKGSWTPCCHSKLTPMPECILNKPGELTNYKGEGHELCYWENQEAKSDTVFQFWISIEQAQNLFLNKDKWSDFKWKSIGVGIFKCYASVWIGEDTDTAPEPAICKYDDQDSNLVIPGFPEKNDIVTCPYDRYWLIFGSYVTLDDAKEEMNKFRKEGFNEAKVLVKDGTFRVSLSDHPTMGEARSAQKRLPEKYQEAWILKH